MIDDAKLEEWKRLAEAATPGPWTADCMRADEGRGRYNAYGVHVEVRDKTRSIFDTFNSEEQEIHEDDGARWDEVGRRNMEFAAAAREAVPALVAAILSERQSADKRVSELLGVMGSFWAFLQGEYGVKISAEDHDDHNVSDFLDAIAGKPFTSADKRVQEARDKALEEAATVADDEARTSAGERRGVKASSAPDAALVGSSVGGEGSAKTIARQIRTLASTPAQEAKP